MIVAPEHTNTRARTYTQVAARVAVEDCVKAMVDKKEEHARVAARVEKAKLRAARTERFRDPPQPAERVINPHAKHAKLTKDAISSSSSSSNSNTATATATATAVLTSPTSLSPSTSRGTKKGGRGSPPLSLPQSPGSHMATLSPRGTSPDKPRPFKFT
jgi:hypothetical protein